LADTEAQSKVRESVKEKKVQKRYQEEFKREAVELVIHSGKSQAQIARELGVSEYSLTLWKKEYLRRVRPAVLGPAHPIDCFIEMFGDMKLVMHDLGLGRCLASGAQVRLPHVDSDRFNLVTLLGPEPCPEFLAGLSSPVRYNIQNPALFQIGHQADIILPAAKALLVNADKSYCVHVATLQASFHGSLDTWFAISAAPENSRTILRECGSSVLTSLPIGQYGGLERRGGAHRTATRRYYREARRCAVPARG
jgi:hypothetical protein